MLSVSNETLSPLGETLSLSGKTSIETLKQYFLVKYLWSDFGHVPLGETLG